MNDTLDDSLDDFTVERKTLKKTSELEMVRLDASKYLPLARIKN